MKRVGFFGFNETAIVNLINHKEFNLQFVITQRDRLSIAAKALLQMAGIPCEEIDGKTDLYDHLEMIQDVELILICYFGVIVPADIYNKVPCFNIHTGDLHTNRGPYPLVWNILLNESEATSTLHRLGNEIDSGEIISVCKVPIGEKDNIESLSGKLNNIIEIHLSRLAKYNENQTYEVVENGIYRKKVQLADILIRFEDKIETIERKIRAQSQYGGAYIDFAGLRFRVNQVKLLNEYTDTFGNSRDNDISLINNSNVEARQKGCFFSDSDGRRHD